MGVIQPEFIREKFDKFIRQLVRKYIALSADISREVIDLRVNEVRLNPVIDSLVIFPSTEDNDNQLKLTLDGVNTFWRTVTRIANRESEQILVMNPDGTKELEDKKPLSEDSLILSAVSHMIFFAFNTIMFAKLSQINGQLQSTGIPLQEVQFRTIGDKRVDPAVCRPLDGKRWIIGDPNIVVPPRMTHINCRCILLPLI